MGRPSERPRGDEFKPASEADLDPGELAGVKPPAAGGSSDPPTPPAFGAPRGIGARRERARVQLVDMNGDNWWISASATGR